LLAQRIAPNATGVDLRNGLGRRGQTGGRYRDRGAGHAPNRAPEHDLRCGIAGPADESFPLAGRHRRPSPWPGCTALQAERVASWRWAELNLSHRRMRTPPNRQIPLHGGGGQAIHREGPISRRPRPGHRRRRRAGRCRMPGRPRHSGRALAQNRAGPGGLSRPHAALSLSRGIPHGAARIRGPRGVGGSGPAGCGRFRRAARDLQMDAAGVPSPRRMVRRRR
jgi:hypothetical protein